MASLNSPENNKSLEKNGRKNSPRGPSIDASGCFSVKSFFFRSSIVFSKKRTAPLNSSIEDGSRSLTIYMNSYALTSSYMNIGKSSKPAWILNARENYGHVYFTTCGTKYGYRTLPSKRTYQRDELAYHYKYKYYSPLTISCYSKQTEIVKLLLSKQCDINIAYMTTNWRADERRKFDALHAACRRQNNQEIIDLLMEKKKDWKFEHITEEYDCDATMIAYVNSKRIIEEK